MTVIGKTEKNAPYWHVTFEELKGKSHANYVLALVYLAMGQDYAYRMAKEIGKIDFEGSKALKNQTTLQPLLSRLEKGGFLLSEEELENGRKRKYFSINPKILISPNGLKPYHIPGESGLLGIADEDIKNFLDQLSNRGKDRARYLEQWNQVIGVKKWDFITFLLFMQEAANDLKMSDLSRRFSEYISEVQRLEREGRRVQVQAVTTNANLRCEDPSKCPDPDCTICPDAGIKTCWS